MHATEREREREREMEAYTHTNPFSSHVLIFLLTLILFISNMQSISASNTKTNTIFIKTACNSTTYPQLCFKSLSSYASKIQTSPQKLANAALTVTLKAANNASSMVSELLRQQGLKTIEVAAIKDCIEEIGDSIDELQQSLKAMGLLGGADVKFQMANIKTWVSAAITDEYTCTDEFDDHSTVSTALKNKIKKKIVGVAKLTSNALALINNLSVY